MTVAEQRIEKTPVFVYKETMLAMCLFWGEGFVP